MYRYDNARHILRYHAVSVVPHPPYSDTNTVMIPELLLLVASAYGSYEVINEECFISPLGHITQSKHWILQETCSGANAAPAPADKEHVIAHHRNKHLTLAGRKRARLQLLRRLSIHKSITSCRKSSRTRSRSFSKWRVIKVSRISALLRAKTSPEVG